MPKRPKQLLSLLLVPALAILISACGKAPARTEIHVSAAISLKDALNEIRKIFEKEHPNADIVYNFGASGILAGQIAQGAPADVFVSASKGPIDFLAGKGLIQPGTVKDCAGNRLLVVSRTKKIAWLSDLLKLDRIAVGNPQTVPAGEYTMQALSKEGIYEQLKSKQKLVFAEDARQVLSYVDSGDVDAGIVYHTDAIQSGKPRVSFKVDKTLTEPIQYQIVCLKDSKEMVLALEFENFLLGSQSKRVFLRKGFVYE